MDVKQHLSQLCNQAGITKAELGRRIGAESNTMAGWASRSQIPTKWVKRIAQTLGITTDQVLAIQPPEPGNLDRRTLASKIYEAACRLPPERQAAALAAIRAMLPD